MSAGLILPSPARFAGTLSHKGRGKSASPSPLVGEGQLREAKQGEGRMDARAIPTPYQSSCPGNNPRNSASVRFRHCPGLRCPSFTFPIRTRSNCFTR
jgi:hypothetical protein